MAEFNVADGSVATVMKEGSPMALIKGHVDDTWFYAPRAAVITRSTDGTNRPQYMVVRNRRRLPNGDGFETIGGVFACQLELSVPLPGADEQKQWTEHIRITSSIRLRSQGFRFQPMRLRDGRLSIQGVDQYVIDPSKLKDIRVGASSTIPLTLELNKLGADTFATALNTPRGNGLPVTAFMQFKYDMVVPACKYEIRADGGKVYDFFSVNVKARASYWGLVGAQADIQRTREELQASGAIVIKQISAPQGLEDSRIKQLESAIIDSWIKNILNKICEKPQMNPAEAPNPSGFFGGISVALKSRTDIMNLQLSATVEYSSLLEEQYNLSYVFGPLVGQGDPRDHLLDVTEDNKLPVVINLCRDERIHRYTGQFGYRKRDNTFVANAITDVVGNAGAVLTGSIQFAVGEPMPEKTEVQLSVDWDNTNWEDRKEKHEITNDSSGAAFVYSPGNNIAKVKIITDLEMSDPGTIAIVNYKTKMPPFQGQPVKVYSGSLVVLGQGSNGKIMIEEVEFPYHSNAAQGASKLAWEVSITKTDGTSINKKGELDVTTSALPLLRAILLSAPPGSDSSHSSSQPPGEGNRMLIEAIRRSGRVRPQSYVSAPGEVSSSPPSSGPGDVPVVTGFDSSMRF